MLLDLEGKMQAAAAKLIPSLIISTVKYIGNGIDHKLAEGYWRLEVRTKHVSFNVMSFEKLILDRKLLMSSIVLWHISAIDWCYMPAILATSRLHAMGRAALCG
jgi:hypothetical protein